MNATLATSGLCPECRNFVVYLGHEPSCSKWDAKKDAVAPPPPWDAERWAAWEFCGFCAMRTPASALRVCGGDKRKGEPCRLCGNEAPASAYPWWRQYERLYLLTDTQELEPPGAGRVRLCMTRIGPHSPEQVAAIARGPITMNGQEAA